MNRIFAITVAALATLVLTACGESPEENAQQAVCDARQDMANQVDSLKALTPATFSTDAVSENLSAIQSDLSDIKDEQSELADDRRQQVESANKAFTSQVETLVKGIGTGTTSADSLTAAVQQLAASYEQTFSRIDCS